MAYDVFISYRRQGGGADARMMYDRLVQSGYTVSFDMDTLKNGNFNEELLKRVAECKNFVVLLSENCFERTLNGCKREDDWLRIEIATALYNNKNIVTVMLPGFVFPPNLPPDIDEIRNKNGPKYDLYYIDGFYDKLKKDFLVKEDAAGAATISSVEQSFEPPPPVDEGEADVADLLGDDSDFLRSEAILKYEAVSRLLPFSELEALDGVWNDAEMKKADGDYKGATALYMTVMDLCTHATPCSLPFAMRMAADGIDTRKRDWFETALARAQGGDVDYEYGVGSVYAGGLGVRKDVSAAFRWYERAAQHGNFQAMAAIGAAYLSGVGVESDYAAAKVWLEKAAESGLPVAEERLGFLYRNGLGVEQDLACAVDWYRKAAANGNSSARTALGDMYMRGEGVEADRERAIAWYREAAADDQPQALVALAGYLFEHDRTDHSEAIVLCRRAVNAGDAEAIALLGRAYENGWGMEKDVMRAAELYAKAKERGSVNAEDFLCQLDPQVQYRLGFDYMEGRGVEQNYAVARAWFGKAAEQGHVEAMAWFGHLLAKGVGGDVDMQTAIGFYEKAAAGGSAVALVDMGQMYRNGKYYKEDNALGMECYRKVAARWSEVPCESRWYAIAAFNRLALMYKKGEACQKDPLLAARFYRFAAMAGSIAACRNLGILYRDGIGVAKSREQMEHWFAEMWRLAGSVLNPCDGESMCSLGAACQSGQGVPRDLMAASEWWHRGMAQFDFNSAVHLSNAGKQHPELLRDGDEAAVIDQYEKEALAGLRVAMSNLGVRYRFGRGVKADSVTAAEWYRKAAELGYGGAMRALGDMYDAGDGVEQDKEIALQWIMKAAEADDQIAKRRLATRYNGGTSLGRDFQKSMEWLEKALEKDPEDVYAARQLALAYRDGKGVEEDAGRARNLFASVIGVMTRLAEDQKADSQDDLADCYYHGWGVKVDLKRAAELYELAAKGMNEHAMDALRRFFRLGIGCEPDRMKSDEWAQAYLAEKTKDGGDGMRGMPDACVSVGNYYRCGYGVEADAKIAFGWFEKAAAKKSWEAMLKLASMCRDGEGCTRDLAVAEEWAKKAVAELTPLAENGLAEAQRGFADCHANGWGVEKSPELAAKWYGEAYDGRDWLATGRLARLYASGEGVAQDLGKAVELLTKAAEKEDAEARCHLGECYERGEWGLDTDVAKALELYRQSASEGDAGGLYNLGRCYLEGIGVEKDEEKAWFWLELADAEKGDYWGYALAASQLLKERKGRS